MLQRLILTIVLTFGLPAAALGADDVPDLKRLEAAVEKLVEKYYPKAKVSRIDETIRFEFNTRKFWIHEPRLNGEWQDAFEEIGPQKGGIVGNLVYQPGPYVGMAVVPQSFDKRYFILQLLAPYSKKLDGHLLIHLSYSRDADPEFLKEFGTLVKSFDEYVEKDK